MMSPGRGGGDCVTLWASCEVPAGIRGGGSKWQSIVRKMRMKS